VKKVLRSFKPYIDRRSRVLILGSMPGPVALKKQQFYGFDGNHFWHIIPKLFGVPRPPDYQDRLRLIRKNRIALWDVLYSCTRESALDAHIRDVKPNKIPQLLKKYPNIRAVFINGRFAHDTFHKCFEGKINRPVFYLPSTSPAHASLTLQQKIRKWSAIKKYLK
jgi:hypoxanthine-DNA glycosylase